MRFGFAQALSMMLWLAVAICWLEALLYRIEALLPMVLALAALCAPLPGFFPGRVTPDAYSLQFMLHLFAGMAAYSLFTVATLHSVLISVIARQSLAWHSVTYR